MDSEPLTQSELDDIRKCAEVEASEWPEDTFTHHVAVNTIRLLDEHARLKKTQ